MYIVYILKSITAKRYYIGQTNDLKRRLADHNRGKDHATRFGKPWTLVRKEAYNTRAEAMARERYLKSLKKRASIESIITAG